MPMEKLWSVVPLYVMVSDLVSDLVSASCSSISVHSDHIYKYTACSLDHT